MAVLTRGLSERFEEFLRGFEDKDGERKYQVSVGQMAATGRKSVVLDYEDLIHYDTDLAESLLSDPDRALKEFKSATFEVLSTENLAYAGEIRKNLMIRTRGITDRVALRKVDTSHLDKMIAFAGMVIRTSELRPLLVDAAFVCPDGHTTRVIQEGPSIKKPVKCEGCDETRNLELDQKDSTFIDSQILRVQELPEELPPGQLPRFFDIDVEGDIVNTARPGDRAVMTGIVRAEPDYSFGTPRSRSFRSKIDANYIEVVSKEPSQVQITKEDEAIIKSIASSPDAYQKLIKSMAPGILGHDRVKEAMLLLLVGGPTTALPDGTKLRGDINVFLVGDPGVAKSEMLKFAAQVAPRGMFASGRGSTAAGLSAAVIREKNTLMLEAGVVVLADQGIACLHPESTVLLDGESIRVGELAETLDFKSFETLSGGDEVAELGRNVVTLEEGSLSTKVAPSTKVRKRWHSGDILRLGLRSGFTALVTPDHLFLDGNTMEWKEASRFAAGELIAAPQRIPGVEVRDIFLWDVLPGGCKVSLTPEERLLLRVGLEARYGSVRAAAVGLGITRIPEYFRSRLQPTLSELKTMVKALGEEEAWRSTPHVYDKSPINSATITPEMAYLCGFVYGDGHVKTTRRRAAITVTQSPVHSEYIARFKRYWSLYFGPLSLREVRKARSRIGGKPVSSERIDWSVSRRIFGHIYSHLTGQDLGRLLSFPQEVLKGFLAGVTDSDGYNGKKLCAKKGAKYEAWNIVYEASRHKQANLNLLLSLRAFGVVGSFRGIRGGVGVIVISSRGDCLRLQQALSSYSVKMSRRPSPRKNNVSGASEKLPRKMVSSAFKEVFKDAARTPLIDAGVWSTVYEYMNERRQPSTGQVLRVVSKTAGVSGAPGLASLAKDKDYFLDEIVDVSRERYEGYVYDLMMRKDHNYVGDGVFNHNCIDEFDKMKPEDRSALHEQMEQQTITIAKGGIYATLNARTAIFAATNPILGKYDPYQNLIDNINLPIPLLTRFDLIFVLRDTPVPGQDEKLATHILDVHRKKTYVESPPIQFELLKKYMAFAKNYSPVLSMEAENRIKDYYLQLRRNATEGSIGATPRTLEGLVRLASAKARLMLREEVTEDDALTAIELMNKMVEDVLTDAETKTKADFGILLGQPAGERGKLATLMDTLRALEGPERKPIEAKVFRMELMKTNKFANEDEVDKLIQKITKEGIIFESKPGFFRRVQA